MYNRFIAAGAAKENTKVKNLDLYNAVLAAIPQSDKSAFISYFFGYISSGVPQKEWLAALERARGYATAPLPAAKS